MKSIEEMTEAAAGVVLAQIGEEGKRRRANSDVEHLCWQMGDGIEYETAVNEIVAQAIKLDREQRDIYELIAEALDERAELGADDAAVASNAAAEIRSERHDHVWTSYIGPMLDELQEEFGTTAPKCDQCDEEATEFYPNLKEPVQFCDSCEHNAIRGGWEPGR